MAQYTPIAETPNFIVLDSYTKYAALHEPPTGYQTESELENEFIADLRAQGYEYLPDLRTPEALRDNVRRQLETLNEVHFTDAEWQRFCDEFLDCPGETITGRTRKVQDSPVHDFTFDDGRLQNIHLVDKRNPARNKLQVINQFEQKGTHKNRYDVTILVNGLPMVQVELKKRGVAVREAFNQVHRYSKESFNSEASLYKYLQLFVISNGTDTRYFANTVKREKNSFDFTMNWARADNTAIKDLKDFTATFFRRDTLLQVLLTYAVFDRNGTLMMMRPYQIAATERIIWKIRCAHEAKQWGCPEGGGYVWHTTGSGKTLTSFKAARLATQLEFVDKVFFVVDRKDLDYQTMNEYKRFSPDSVNGSASTAGLKRNLAKHDNKIIVTTIQKLNNLMKSEPDLPVYRQEVVFIFDECHRSQFGEAQRNLQRKFKKYYQFGFTGTPIFSENAAGAETTASVFGRELHSYVITDAIRDEKVLKFKVDYNNVRPKFKAAEKERDERKLTSADYAQLMLHPDRIGEIAQYILRNFRLKTHRAQGGKGFNAMFAVSSVEAAKRYYDTLRMLQQGEPHPLRIATIFSFAPNEAQHAVGEIDEETLEPEAMDASAKEFLSRAIKEDYNVAFATNFSVDGAKFQNYYHDLARRVKTQEVDLLIVVGMFLTGFDAPKLNTLFVDKNLRYHGLIQAFSRTNRIYDATKTFGNIVTFRDLERDTVDAISLFGDKNTKNVVLERSYAEQLAGFTDALTGEERRGFAEIVAELCTRFPDPDEIDKEADKKAFVKLFGEYLRAENILQNYDEFTQLKEFQQIEQTDVTAVEAFKTMYCLTDEDIALMRTIELPTERTVQDYRSTYNGIREWKREQDAAKRIEQPKVDWDDVVFEVELLKSQEFTLDYILELVFEHSRRSSDKQGLVEEVRRTLRASLGNRAKEGLMVDFINRTDLQALKDKDEVMDAFYTYARERRDEEVETLIEEEQLNTAAAKRFIRASLKRELVSENGTDLSEALPKMSPLHPAYVTKKQSVFQKIVAFVEKFKGIGGEL